MLRICPSILNANFDDLPGEIMRVASESDLLHLDVMDGIFVPNFTFDFPAAARIIEGSILPVDVHLMIADAHRSALSYLETAAASITVHLEACEEPIQTLRAIRASGKRAALAIKPNTSIELVEPFLNDLDMILVMTVEPGFGGQRFIAEMMPKVEQARAWLSRAGLEDIWLQVDGGINEETIQIARRAGADTFVAGSVIYRAPDPAQMAKTLRHLAERAT